MYICVHKFDSARVVYPWATSYKCWLYNHRVGAARIVESKEKIKPIKSCTAWTHENSILTAKIMLPNIKKYYSEIWKFFKSFSFLRKSDKHTKNYNCMATLPSNDWYLYRVITLYSIRLTLHNLKKVLCYLRLRSQFGYTEYVYRCSTMDGTSATKLNHPSCYDLNQGNGLPYS